MGLRPGETEWRWLPNGVECFWQSGRNALVVAALISLLSALNFSLLATHLFGHPGDVYRAAPNALVAAVLPILFGYLVLRSIRGRGQPSRLLATIDDGLLVWAWANQRPRLAIPRNLVSEIRVEGDMGWFDRSWRLVVIVKTGWRVRRILFTSVSRGELENTANALRFGLQIN